MKTAISIPDELYEAAERAAKRLGLSRSELYQRAVGAFVAQHSDRLVTAALNQIYGDDDTDGLDPALAAMQSASHEQEQW